MKNSAGKITSAFLLMTSLVVHAEPVKPLLHLQAVPFTSVKITDLFWAPRQETNRIASIPVSLDNLEKAGNLENFRLAARGQTNGFSGPFFMDSDVYKAIEAASFSLATHPDPVLALKLDTIIATVASAQRPDGYLDTYFTVAKPGKRWTNLRDCHELYCAGHLIEGAVAHYQATGQRNFLDVAIKLANYIDSVFGPAPKRMGYPGHPEIELALVKLWHVTGDRRYFELARFFIENRGTHFFATEHNTPEDQFNGEYWLDDVPIFDHQKIKGHAVRATYLMSGATDVAGETGDERLLNMLDRVWQNTATKNMYITGGIGPSASNEGFTVDYDLPNQSAYQETCATVSLAQWNARMALLYGDAKYADIVERGLYNGMLAGVSQNGTRFFYVNPLESKGDHHRQEWFGCACCPPNAARTIAAVGGYAYATGSNSFWVNLYIQGSVTAEVAGKKLNLAVETEYPWNGHVELRPELGQPTTFDLHLRVPGWSHDATVSVNGANITAPVQDGYFVLSREWQQGDKIELELPMPVERVAADPHVVADTGLLAIQRGPMVYCVEQSDFSEPISKMYLPAESELKAGQSTVFPNLTYAITGEAESVVLPKWHKRLYDDEQAPRKVPFTAIPYFAWDNRQAGAMKVWLPTAPLAEVSQGVERDAQVTLSFVSGNCTPSAINDGVEPKSSGDSPPAMCHWWPHKGSEEWAQYVWPAPVNVSGAKVYWFDDTGHGECRLPERWEMEYKDGDEWKPVVTTDSYAIAKDRWCEVKFSPIQTTAMRLKLKLQPGWAAGIHEWKLIETDN